MSSRQRKKRPLHEEQEKNGTLSSSLSSSTAFLLWTCHICTLQNPIRKKRCEVCETRRLPPSFLEDVASTEINNKNENTSTTENDLSDGKVMSWLSKRKKKRKANKREREVEGEEEEQHMESCCATQQNQIKHPFVMVRIYSKDFNEKDILEKENESSSPKHQQQRLQAIWQIPPRPSSLSNQQQLQRQKVIQVRIQSKEENVHANNNKDNDDDFDTTLTLQAILPTSSLSLSGKLAIVLSTTSIPSTPVSSSSVTIASCTPNFSLTTGKRISDTSSSITYNQDPPPEQNSSNSSFPNKQHQQQEHLGEEKQMTEGVGSNQLFMSTGMITRSHSSRNNTTTTRIDVHQDGTHHDGDGKDDALELESSTLDNGKAATNGTTTTATKDENKKKNKHFHKSPSPSSRKENLSPFQKASNANKSTNNNLSTANDSSKTMQQQQQEYIDFSQNLMTQQLGCNFEYTPQSQDHRRRGTLSSNSYTQQQQPHFFWYSPPPSSPASRGRNSIPSSSSSSTKQLTQRLNKWLDTQSQPASLSSNELSKAQTIVREGTKFNSTEKIGEKSSSSSLELPNGMCSSRPFTRTQDLPCPVKASPSATKQIIKNETKKSQDRRDEGKVKTKIRANDEIRNNQVNNDSNVPKEYPPNFLAEAPVGNNLVSKYKKTDASLSSSYASIMFYTAGKGKKTQVSEESLIKATQLLSKEPFIMSKSDDTSTMLEGAKSTLMVGFATAGKGTSITLSEESMAKALQLWHPETKETTNSSKTSMSINSSFDQNILSPQTHPTTADFQTAGKVGTISISEESLHKATEFTKQPIFGDTSSSHEPAFIGKSRQVIASTDGEGDKKNTLDGIRMNSIRTGSTVFKASSIDIASYTTAGRIKRKAVREDSLAKASKLLQMPSKKKSRKGFARVACHNAKSSFTLVAGGTRSKNMQLSKPSLEKCSELLKDPPVSSKLYATPIPVFATAGRVTKTTVSKESVTKASKLLQLSSETYPDGICNHAERLVRKSMVAFQTAGSGTNLQVSDDSLEKDGRLLNDEKVSKPSSLKPVAAFATAGTGTKITVSEESVTKASKLLQLSFETNPGGICNHAERLPHTSNAEIDKTTRIMEDLAIQSNLSKSAPKSPPTHHKRSSQKGISAVRGARSIVKTRNSTLPGFLGGIASDKSVIRPLDSSHTSCYETDRITERNVGVATFSESPTEKSIRTERESSLSNTPGQAKAGYSYELAVPNIQSTSGEDSVTAINEKYTLKGTRLPLRSSDQYKLVEDTRETNSSTIHVSTPSAIDAQTPMTGWKEKQQITINTGEPFPYSSVKYKENTKPGTWSIKRHGLSLAVSGSASLTESFTPHQIPAPRKAVVTMSTSVKNPYLKKRNNDAIALEKTNDDFSPVPFKFRHIEGTFRGKRIFPKSISQTKKLISRCSDKPTEFETSSNTPRVLNFSIQTPHRGQILTSFSPRFDEKAKYDAISKLRTPQDSSRISLSQLAKIHGEMTNIAHECTKLGVKTATIGVDSTNATELRFDGVTGLPCGFLGLDEASEGKRIGEVENYHKALIDLGCDSNLLRSKWISNHVRWIVWKLAATERRFPAFLAGKYLTYENVVLQLHKRYAKEISNGKHPALRKILNRDIASSRLMTLCVSQVSMGNINSNGKHQDKFVNKTAVRLELTDGWYSVQASLDTTLTDFVKRRKIVVGTKLTTCNVFMNGAEDGIDPLDDAYISFGENCPILLDLTANATRLAKWDAKLGFVDSSMCPQYGLLRVKALPDIIPGGGNIPLIDLIICRRYPRLYVEEGADDRNDGTELDGRSKVLTEIQEETARKDFEKHRQKAIEKIHEQVRKDCEKDIDELTPEIWKNLVKCDSPQEFYERLSNREKMDVDRWRGKRSTLLQYRIRQEIEAEMECDDSLARVSTPFIRLRVNTCQFNRLLCDDGKTEHLGVCDDAILTIKRASEEQVSFLREGSIVRFQNLAARSTKFEGLLHLTTCAKTKMERLPSNLVKIPRTKFYQRSFVSFFRVILLSKKLMKKVIPTFPAPEIDVAGISLKTILSGNGSKVFYLTDETGLLLRVHKDDDPDESYALQTLPFSARQNIEYITTISFKDLRVMPFDQVEKCAVAVFSQTSSVALQSGCRRIQELKKWAMSVSGKLILMRISASIDASIPTIEHRDARIQVVVGYIVGFTVCTTGASTASSDESCEQLQVMVDCGKKTLDVWEFPLFLLDEALRLCSSGGFGEGATSSLEEERIHLSLKHLGCLFRGSGTLLHFVLKQKRMPGSQSALYEVRRLKVADPLALSQAYASVCAWEEKQNTCKPSPLPKKKLIKL